jgi:hypothetical protein
MAAPHILEPEPSFSNQAGSPCASKIARFVEAGSFTPYST